MLEQSKLHDALIKLHDVARLIEQEIGSGSLSEDVRHAADRLATLIKPFEESTK